MAATLFVVRRKADRFYRPPEDAPAPEEQYLGTFATRQAAEQHVRSVDREYKLALNPRTVNPFSSQPFDQLTTFPGYALRDWLRDADIDPPPALPRKFAHREQQTWVDWWEQSAGGWTAAQRERVWDGLNLLRFVELESVEVASGETAIVPEDLVVFMVVHKHWEFDDSHYRGANDALTVFRTRASAESEVRRLSDERRREDWNGGPDEYVIVEMLIQPEG